MKVASLAKPSVSVAVATVILVFAFAISAQVVQPQNNKPFERQINLLVLGDSISWGQGLKDEHKAWYQLKAWLQKLSGLPVAEKVEAHSGAVIGSEGDSPADMASLYGEVNRG